MRKYTPEEMKNKVMKEHGEYANERIQRDLFDLVVKPGHKYVLMDEVREFYKRILKVELGDYPRLLETDIVPDYGKYIKWDDLINEFLTVALGRVRIGSRYGSGEYGSVEYLHLYPKDEMPTAMDFITWLKAENE